MRIFFLTQNDPFYLPSFFHNFLKQNQEVVGIGIGKKHNTSFVTVAKRFYHLLGFKEFMIHGLQTIIYKMKDTLAYNNNDRFYSVKTVARRAGIPVYQVNDVNDKSFINFLKEKVKPDIIVSIVFSQMLKKEVLNVPPLGCINLHSGKLPHYRGMLPTFWAMLNGEREVGISIHYINEKIDEGDIIVQLGVPLHKDDSLHSVISKSKSKGLEALLIALDRIRNGKVDVIRNEPSKGSYFSFPTRKDSIRFRELGWKFR